MADDAAAEAFAKEVLKLTPPVSFDEALQQTVTAVENAVKQVFTAGAEVIPFGSIIQSAHLPGSDLDLCLDVPDLPDAAAEEGAKQDNTAMVQALQKLVLKLPKNFTVLETRYSKTIKVPIVMLSFKSSKGHEVETDISAGKVYDGVEKDCTDRLIRRILVHSPKLLHMVRIIKWWAKAEKLNKAYDGYLNSLGWALLVVYYFLEKGEVASDAMNEEEPTERVEGSSSALPPRLHPPEPDDLEEFWAPEPSEIAEFFEWVGETAQSWPVQGSYGLSLVDTRLIEVPKPTKTWADSTSFYIEDPGPRVTKGTSDNVARSVKMGPWQVTMKKCAEAAKVLRAEKPQVALNWIRSLSSKVASERAKAAKAAADKARAAKAPVLAPRTLAAQGVALRPAMMLAGGLRPGFGALAAGGVRPGIGGLAAGGLRPAATGFRPGGPRPPSTPPPGKGVGVAWGSKAGTQAPLRPGVQAPVPVVAGARGPAAIAARPGTGPVRPGTASVVRSSTPQQPKRPPPGVLPQTAKAGGVAARPTQASSVTLKRPMQPAQPPPAKILKTGSGGGDACKWFLQGQRKWSNG